MRESTRFRGGSVGRRRGEGEGGDMSTGELNNVS